MRILGIEVNCDVCLQLFRAELKPVLVVGKGNMFEPVLRPVNLDCQLKPSWNHSTKMDFVCDGCRQALNAVIIESVEGIRSKATEARKEAV